jgi:hypothetical protein
MIETNNYVEQQFERLQRRLDELVSINQPWQCEERREVVEREMTHIAFEMSERYREEKAIQIEEAWNERV